MASMFGEDEELDDDGAAAQRQARLEAELQRHIAAEPPDPLAPSERYALMDEASGRVTLLRYPGMVLTAEQALELLMALGSLYDDLQRIVREEEAR